MCAEVAQRGSEADAEDGESLLFVSVLSVGHKVNSASGSQPVKKCSELKSVTLRCVKASRRDSSNQRVWRLIQPGISLYVLTAIYQVNIG